MRLIQPSKADTAKEADTAMYAIPYHAVHPLVPVLTHVHLLCSHGVDREHSYGQFLAVLTDIPPEGEGCISLDQWRLTPGSAVREGHVG